MVRTSVAALAVILTAGSLHAAEYHVSPGGRDYNRGDETRPFKTISAAARVAQPGDVVTVHEGVYRERVNPARGGTSATRRIVYRAAEGENVEIKGSEIIKSWEKAQDGVWKVTLPNTFFRDFNPYTDVIKGEWHKNKGYPRHTGTVYVNGDWMDEARSLEQVAPSGGRAAVPQTGSRDVVLGGKTASYEGTAIAGTDEDTLYQTCRYDLRGYRLAVPNGMCRVTLKFCEPHFAARAQRVFDVKLQGKTVLSGFDIFAKVGRFTAHDETFEGIKVTDGQLKIDIINRVSLACISGIVVRKGSDSRRINCGGPGWKGYRPDPASRSGRDAVVSGRPLWKAEVDETNTTIWAQFSDIDPNRELVEINVRQSVFYPDKPGRNYITVRGFTMRHAATPWTGAMSEQIGLIGTHWSKGWVIEDNVISHSMNTGITLGRYDLGRLRIAMPAATAPGFVKSCELALEHGWSRAKIGSHVVRNNHISHCEKNGIHGSLGGVFSTIEGNTIHDIAMRGWIGGADVAGLKLLASNDVIIRNNHFYRCGGFGGVWLDWMAQGTRFTGNLLHDNRLDLFMEVDHGPFLVDHNLLLSGNSLRDWSQGGAYAHNLIMGSLSDRKEGRRTPYFRPHTLADMKLSSIQQKDQRFHNNLFIGSTGLAPFKASAASLQAAGNVYLAGAKPSGRDHDVLVVPDFKADPKLEEKPDGWWFEMAVDPAWVAKQKRALVTTNILGKAQIPNARFEQPDGTPYRLDTDYSGRMRDTANPAPGSFRFSGERRIRIKVRAK
ncbi:MAG: malectin domain-containing carbohydrate-binding protein [Planctomycetota bacterium]|jgi:hypothetical protein